jgi:hypothetical protein
MHVDEMKEKEIQSDIFETIFRPGNKGKKSYVCFSNLALVLFQICLQNLFNIFASILCST